MAQDHLTVGLTTFSAARLGVAAFMLASAVLAGPAFAGDDHIGAERCGACHQAQYEAWRKTPHADALARLTEKQQQDPQCRSCHTMDPWSQDAALAGVQCESCHGPGRAYAPDYVMRDKNLSSLMGLKPVDASTCQPCHRADAPRLRPFDYTALVKMVMHAQPESTDGQ